MACFSLLFAAFRLPVTHTLTSNVSQKALSQGVQTLLPQVFFTCSPGRKVSWNAAFSLRLTFVGRDFKTEVNQARLCETGLESRQRVVSQWTSHHHGIGTSKLSLPTCSFSANGRIWRETQVGR